MLVDLFLVPFWFIFFCLSTWWTKLATRQLFKLKLHFYDLLWICFTTCRNVVDLWTCLGLYWICCRFVVYLLWFILLYKWSLNFTARQILLIIVS